MDAVNPDSERLIDVFDHASGKTPAPAVTAVELRRCAPQYAVNSKACATPFAYLCGSSVMDSR